MEPGSLSPFNSHSRQISFGPLEYVRRVLSIQSHVVHGYVGNRAAVFPLQLLGFEVDVVNSVQFSCHTGYPRIAGQKMNGEELKVLLDGLSENQVLDHQHLLTGYIGTASFLREVVNLIQRLPPTCRYICDPVLGDNGKLYVAEECVEVYRKEVLQHVTVLTPNRFEAELLTQSKIEDLVSAAGVCDALHEAGPETVVLTTLDVPDATRNGECVAMMLSQKGRAKWILQAPLISGGPFTGTGDLTSAMLLAWTQFHPHEMPLALEKAAAVLQSVINRTVKMDSAKDMGGKRVPPELRIIESKRVIEEPSVLVRCRLLEQLVFTGVVFDLDGTLTLPFLLDLSGLRNRLNIPARADVVPWLREQHKDDKAALDEALLVIQKEELKTFDAGPQVLQPGLKDSIAKLQSRGVKLGIFTRNCQAAVDAFLQLAELPADTFHPVITRDSGLVSKPSPSPILHCCKEWGMEPESVLVVGDGLDDITSGHAAGSKTVAMLRPSTTDLEEAAKVAMQEDVIVKASDFNISNLSSLDRFFP